MDHVWVKDNFIRYNHDTLKKDTFTGLITKRIEIPSSVRNSSSLEVDNIAHVQTHY